MIGFYILIGVISLVSWLISNTLKKKFDKYSKVSLRNGMSGAEIAEKMLADQLTWGAQPELQSSQLCSLLLLSL